MKILSFIFLLLLLPVLCSGQYYVVKVNGKVFANNKLMQPRLKLEQETALKFENEQAFAHVISPMNGHFILDGQKARRNQRGEFLAALKDALVPPHQFEAAATRATPPETTLRFSDEYDMKAWFRGKVLFLESLSFSLDESYFGPAEDLKIVVIHQSRRPIPAHSIAAEDEMFRLTPEIFRDARGRNRARHVEESTIELQNSSGETLYSFGPFEFHQLKKKHRKELEREMDFLASIVKVEDAEEFCQNHLMPYLALHYGKASHESAHRLME
jgi:hypothetical protein